MKLILSAGVLIYMFLSTSVAAKLGITQVGTFSSSILVSSFFLNFLMDSDQKLVLKFKEEFKIISIGVIIVFVKYYLGQSDQVNSVIFLILVPMFVSILLGTQGPSTKNIIKISIIFFFTMECCLSIYERIVSVNFFGYSEDIELSNIENWSFRSSAFLGHPLTNSLCVSTILGFILTSNLKIWLKLGFMILGFVSMLCFNARAAILIWIILGIFFVINLILDKNTKRHIAVSVVVIFISIIYFLMKLIIGYGFGGRIINEKINDGSSQSRLNVFDSFLYLDKSELWFGNNLNYIPIMKKLGGGGVENSFVVLIINYGIPIFVTLISVYYPLITRFLKPYRFKNKLIIIFSFLILGLTNNALASATPWAFLILCAHAFAGVNSNKYKLNSKSN